MKVAANIQRIVFVASALVFGVGCSPRTEGSVDVPRVPPVEVKRSAENPVNVSVAVVPLLDGRSLADEKAHTDTSKRVYPDGNVGVAVESALSESLIRKGLLVTQQAPITISGEVLEWHSTFQAGINKKVQSTAKIYVEVLNASGKQLFHGNYAGEQALTEPLVSDRDVNVSLGKAMQQAVAQLVDDRDFLDAVWNEGQKKQDWRIQRTPTEIR